MCEGDRQSKRERASVMYCIVYSVQSSVEQTTVHVCATFHELSKLQTFHLHH